MKSHSNLFRKKYSVQFSIWGRGKPNTVRNTRFKTLIQQRNERVIFYHFTHAIRLPTKSFVATVKSFVLTAQVKGFS